MAAPWLGAAWASLAVLVPPPEGVDPVLPAPSGLSWLLCASGFICAYFLWRMIRAGIRYGRLSPFRLLAAGAVPWALGLVLVPLVLVHVWYNLLARGAASIEVLVEPVALPRLTGLSIATALLGSAGFSLAVAGFLWRSPGKRWPGLVIALAALAPFVLFVIIWMALDKLTPVPLRAEWMLGAVLTFPFRMALAGAVVTRPQAARPGVDWALSVPVASALLFMAGGSLFFDQSLLRAVFASLFMPDAAATWPIIVQAIQRAAWFSVIGLALILFPATVLAVRHYGIAKGRRAAAARHAWILLLGLALVLLDGLANWHMLATVNASVIARSSGQGLDELDPLAPKSSAQDIFQPPRPPQETIPIPHPSPDNGVSSELTIPEPNDRFEPDPTPSPAGVEDGVPGGTLGGLPSNVQAGPMAGLPTGPQPGGAEQSQQVVPFAALQAQAMHKPQFKLPDDLRAQLIERNQTRAVITTKLLISEQGDVTEAFVLKSSGLTQLDELAIEASKEWRFRPFTVNGGATPVTTSWTVIYRLE